MRKKLTAAEKKARKEKKRVQEIQKQIRSQLSIIGFHRIFEYEDDADGAIKEKEINDANQKISELEKQI
ncbi:hypothetical protein E6Q11_06670 [Candidatus Dojkabacteria bacterium]|uniref:EF-hand domain-containing protein n=1 Tax=Candidatus Dojkabacteria bacterium TaxID=2099670 RepID=A0A5C7J3F2_9BACT|nr:MAG: hypothetical protein E6Q11_06670 [Candidatus Dojkabacteria bacterium]